MVCCQRYPLQGFSGISQQMHVGQGAYAVKYFKRQMFLGDNSVCVCVYRCVCVRVCVCVCQSAQLCCSGTVAWCCGVNQPMSAVCEARLYPVCVCVCVWWWWCVVA